MKDPKHKSNYYTPKEAAARYKISPTTLKRWLKEADIEPLMAGSHYRISEENLVELESKSRVRVK